MNDFDVRWIEGNCWILRTAVIELLPLLRGRERQIMRARFAMLYGEKEWTIEALTKEFAMGAPDPPLAASGVVGIVGPAVPTDHK